MSEVRAEKRTLFAGKSTAFFVLICFSLLQIVPPPFADAAGPIGPAVSVNVKTESPLELAGSLAIPKEIGRIQETFIPEGIEPQSLVLYLQSAHLNHDSETNTKELIHFLQETYGLPLVLLEGGEGRLDSLFFQSFPDAGLKQDILERYLEEGDLTGGEAAAVLSEDYDTEFIGVETQRLYEENKKAFLKAAANEKEILDLLGTIETELDREAREHLSPEAAKFRDAKKAFHRDELHLLEYVKRLAELYASIATSLRGNAQSVDEAIPEIASASFGALPRNGDLMPAPFSGGPPATYPELHSLLTAQSNEKRFTGAEFDIAMNRFVDQFEKKVLPNLDQERRIKVNGMIQDYRTGRLGHGTLVNRMTDLAASAEFHFKVPDVLQPAAAHAETLASIKGTKLFDELERLESWLRDELPQNKREAAVLEDDHHLAILRDLANLELLPKHWEVLRKTVPSELMSRHDVARIDALFLPHYNFYRLANERNNALFQNALRAMEEEKTKVALLATGGFHTKGITERLRDAKVPYILMAPEINHFTEKSVYLDVMHGKRSFMKYFDGSLWDALAKDYAARMAASLKEEELTPKLKRWRDRIIQNTIAEGRVTEAGQYTKYVDALVQALRKEFERGSPLERLSAEELRIRIERELDSYFSAHFENLEQLVERKLDVLYSGMKEMWQEGDVTPNRMKDVVDRMNTAGATYGLATALALINDDQAARTRALLPYSGRVREQIESVAEQLAQMVKEGEFSPDDLYAAQAYLLVGGSSKLLKFLAEAFQGNPQPASEVIARTTTLLSDQRGREPANADGGGMQAQVRTEENRQTSGNGVFAGADSQPARLFQSQEQSRSERSKVPIWSSLALKKVGKEDEKNGDQHTYRKDSNIKGLELQDRGHDKPAQINRKGAQAEFDQRRPPFGREFPHQLSASFSSEFAKRGQNTGNLIFSQGIIDDSSHTNRGLTSADALDRSEPQTGLEPRSELRTLDEEKQRAKALFSGEQNGFQILTLMDPASLQAVKAVYGRSDFHEGQSLGEMLRRDDPPSWWQPLTDEMLRSKTLHDAVEKATSAREIETLITVAWMAEVERLFETDERRDLADGWIKDMIGLPLTGPFDLSGVLVAAENLRALINPTRSELRMSLGPDRFIDEIDAINKEHGTTFKKIEEVLVWLNTENRLTGEDRWTFEDLSKLNIQDFRELVASTLKKKGRAELRVQASPAADEMLIEVSPAVVQSRLREQLAEVFSLAGLWELKPEQAYDLMRLTTPDLISIVAEEVNRFRAKAPEQVDQLQANSTREAADQLMEIQPKEATVEAVTRAVADGLIAAFQAHGFEVKSEADLPLGMPADSPERLVRLLQLRASGAGFDERAVIAKEEIFQLVQSMIERLMRIEEETVIRFELPESFRDVDLAADGEAQNILRDLMRAALQLHAVNSNITVIITNVHKRSLQSAMTRMLAQIRNEEKANGRVEASGVQISATYSGFAAPDLVIAGDVASADSGGKALDHSQFLGGTRVDHRSVTLDTFLLTSLALLLNQPVDGLAQKPSVRDVWVWVNAEAAQGYRFVFRLLLDQAARTAYARAA